MSGKKAKEQRRRHPDELRKLRERCSMLMKLVAQAEEMYLARWRSARAWKRLAARKRAEVLELRAILRTVRRLSKDAISPEEADELRGHLGALIAEVGTLRARLGEPPSICSKHQSPDPGCRLCNVQPPSRGDGK